LPPFFSICCARNSTLSISDFSDASIVKIKTLELKSGCGIKGAVVVT